MDDNDLHLGGNIQVDNIFSNASEQILFQQGEYDLLSCYMFEKNYFFRKKSFNNFGHNLKNI